MQVGIRASGPVAERLRQYVRDRVHKDGAHYERGAAKALAERLSKPPSWVSTYVDSQPAANADLDTALAICDFFHVNVSLFQGGDPHVVPVQPVVKDTRTKDLRRAIQLLERMSGVGHSEAARLLGGLVRVYPLAARSTHSEQPADKTSGKDRKAKSKRKA